MRDEFHKVDAPSCQILARADDKTSNGIVVEGVDGVFSAFGLLLSPFAWR